MLMMSIGEKLKILRKECISCRKCAIGGQYFQGHISNVFSNMCPRAHHGIMVVGQNPGEQEVMQGRPFVGPSGKFFDDAIQKILGIDRTWLYVSNTVRCFTPGNRPPTQEEINNCQHFLDREIEIMQPKLLIALGNFALMRLTNLNGIMYRCGKICQSMKYSVPVLPLLHPSPLNMNKTERYQMFYAGLETIKAYLDGR